MLEYRGFTPKISPMTSDIPTAISDSTNAKILAVSEDLVAGFQREPFHVIAEKSEVPLETVIERIRAMQEVELTHQRPPRREQRSREDLQVELQRGRPCACILARARRTRAACQARAIQTRSVCGSGHGRRRLHTRWARLRRGIASRVVSGVVVAVCTLTLLPFYLTAVL